MMQQQAVAPPEDSLGASAERADQVFYAAPRAIARILCVLLLLAMGAVYATLFFLMPVAEALALLPRLIPLIALGVLGEVGIAYLLSRLSPLRIDESGITLTALGGRKRSLLWSEIESARATKFLFVPYLRVAPARGHRTGPLIIPMAVTDPVRFQSAIRQYAPPRNPVRRFLDDDSFTSDVLFE